MSNEYIDALAALNRLAAYSYAIAASEADYIIVRDALASRPANMPESGEDSIEAALKLWVMVPREPTVKMLREAAKHDYYSERDPTWRSLWKHMIDAAPTAPALVDAKPAIGTPLLNLCEAIVRDAVPATDSGATCFVPRYQIDQLGALLGGVGSGVDDVRVSDGVVWMTESQYAKLLARCDAAAQADASRYRWLRDSALEIAWNAQVSYSPGYEHGHAETMDEAIDAAIDAVQAGDGE